MSTCSGDNAKRNLFNVRPATENVRPDGVDEPSTKFSGKSRHVEEKLISFVHITNYKITKKDCQWAFIKLFSQVLKR